MKTDSITAGGYSLIELAVVIVIAGIILPALILPFTEGVRELKLPVDRGTMNLLAQEEMEKKVIPIPYECVAAWASTPITGFPDYSSTGTVIDVGEGSFDTAAGGTTGFKRITVTVTHGGYSATLTTIKSDWTKATCV